MTVHKKHPADAKAMAGKEESASNAKEDVVVSDVITETTERIEVVEKVPDVENSSSPDLLSDFKEKMIEEELSASGNAPKKNFMWPILFIFIVTTALLVAIFAYKQGVFKQEKVNDVFVSPTPTVTPEPTKTIDLTQYEIEVLNGSGVGGEASRQKTNLEAEGFVVSSVGNAGNSDYTDTIIQAKKEVSKDFLDKLKTVLESSFTVKEEKLSDDASTPIVVILGTKK